MSGEQRQDPLAKVETERRDFLKKIAIAAAFAAPTIATFSVDGMRKKAFAQAAYDAPIVLGLADVGSNRVVVTFSQPMADPATADSRGAVALFKKKPCYDFGLTNGSINDVTWSGNTHQVISYCVDGDETLTALYNWDGCIGYEKFKGLNGLDLVPFSGVVEVSGTCDV